MALSYRPGDPLSDSERRERNAILTSSLEYLGTREVRLILSEEEEQQVIDLARAVHDGQRAREDAAHDRHMAIYEEQLRIHRAAEAAKEQN